MSARAPSGAPAGKPAEKADLRLATHGELVDAGNRFADLADFLDVVDALTTHPDWAEHEAGLATVLRHAAILATDARDAARRAADAFLAEAPHA